MPSPEPSRVRLIRLLHVAQRDLGMDDATYRDLLERVTGKRSSAECTLLELDRALFECRRLGFKIRRGGRPLARDPQSALIRALWLDLHRAGIVRSPSESALGAYVQRMTGVAALQWLDPAQKNRIIEGLKAWRARHA